MALTYRLTRQSTRTQQAAPVILFVRFHMKLCAVSPFCSTDRNVVLAFLRSCDADLVLLPGASKNTPSPEEVQKVLRRNVNVFVEGEGGKRKAAPHLVSCTCISAMPKQVFARLPSAKEIDQLAEALPKRTFSIGGRQVSFFICGELIAFNPDGTVKHGRHLQVDVVANPAHTMMGHWNHLGRKLATLSRHGAALYATNNDREHNRVSTDVRIYKNGEQVSSRKTIEGIAWVACEI